MNGFARLLLESYGEKLDAEGREWLDEILLNAKRMADLIEALLSLSRVARSELNSASVDLSSIARTLVAQLAVDEPARVVDLVINDQLRADLDPRLARALMDNLIRNAWKFTSKLPAARIELGVTDVDGTRAFYVRDNGAGFDMAYREAAVLAVSSGSTRDRVPRHRDRPRDRAAHRSAPRRADLGRRKCRTAARRSTSPFPMRPWSGGDLEQRDPARRGHLERRGSSRFMAFKRCGVANEIVVTRDGVEALDYPASRRRSATRLPAVVLLDLDLPQDRRSRRASQRSAPTRATSARCRS